jgi:hypothetical protein
MTKMSKRMPVFSTKDRVPKNPLPLSHSLLILLVTTTLPLPEKSELKLVPQTAHCPKPLKMNKTSNKKMAKPFMKRVVANLATHVGQTLNQQLNICQIEK